jgi:DNA replication protein DnaC
LFKSYFWSKIFKAQQTPRKDNNYKRRKNAAKLPSIKRLEDFDFSFQPTIDPKHISDLATCRFINTKENVILVGQSGTGKTHLATSLAVKALSKEGSFVGECRELR